LRSLCALCGKNKNPNFINNFKQKKMKVNISKTGTGEKCFAPTKKRTWIAIAISLAGLVAVFTDCSRDSDTTPAPVAVESITLDKTTLLLAPGEEATLTATVTPNNATDKTVTWTSNDPTKAVVTNGKVIASASGTVIITATAGGKTATCTVTVAPLTETWNIGSPTATDVKAKLYGTAPNQTLVITGTGKMKDFIYNSGTSSVNTPWWSIRTNIKTIIIDAGVTSIGAWSFYNLSSLISVTIGSSVTTIGDYAFNSCTALASVNIGNSVTSINGYAFSNCSGLTSVTIGNSVTSITGGAFYNCPGLTSVNIPNSVTSIGSSGDSFGVFESCTGLTSVTIGNSVTFIGKYAFYGCKGLTSVTIPNSVTSIADYAFWNCIGLKTITAQNPTPLGGANMGNGVFDSIDKTTCTLKVPNASVAAYKAAAQWKDFVNITGF
jgi:hypothetical protein